MLKIWPMRASGSSGDGADGVVGGGEAGEAVVYEESEPWKKTSMERTMRVRTRGDSYLLRFLTIVVGFRTQASPVMFISDCESTIPIESQVNIA
jgi:hypothetical protein